MGNCPNCGGTDFRRLARRGLLGKIRFLFGRWPYRCASCRKRFSLNLRSIPDEAKPVSNPNVAFQSHTEKPVAQVLIQAESHEELQKILFRLSSAISSYSRVQARGHVAKTRHATARAGSR